MHFVSEIATDMYFGYNKVVIIVLHLHIVKTARKQRQNLKKSSNHRTLSTCPETGMIHIWMHVINGYVLYSRKQNDLCFFISST